MALGTYTANVSDNIGSPTKLTTSGDSGKFTSANSSDIFKLDPAISADNQLVTLNISTVGSSTPASSTVDVTVKDITGATYGSVKGVTLGRVDVPLNKHGSGLDYLVEVKPTAATTATTDISYDLKMSSASLYKGDNGTSTDGVGITATTLTEALLGTDAVALATTLPADTKVEVLSGGIGGYNANKQTWDASDSYKFEIASGDAGKISIAPSIATSQLSLSKYTPSVAAVADDASTANVNEAVAAVAFSSTAVTNFTNLAAGKYVLTVKAPTAVTGASAGQTAYDIAFTQGTITDTTSSSSLTAITTADDLKSKSTATKSYSVKEVIGGASDLDDYAKLTVDAGSAAAIKITSLNSAVKQAVYASSDTAFKTALTDTSSLAAGDYIIKSTTTSTTPTYGSYTVDANVVRKITLDKSSLSEATANDGSFAGKITVTLAGDEFALDSGKALPIVAKGVPVGVRVQAKVGADKTQAEIYFNGKAKDHQNANDITDKILVSFKKAAFATADLTGGTQELKLSADFAQNGKIVATGGTFAEDATKNDGTLTTASNKLTLTLTDAKFNTSAVLDTDYKFANLPTGYIVDTAATKITDTTATFAFKYDSTVSNASNDASKSTKGAEIQLTNGLFANSNAAAVDTKAIPLKFDLVNSAPKLGTFGVVAKDAAAADATDLVKDGTITFKVATDNIVTADKTAVKDATKENAYVELKIKDENNKDKIVKADFTGVDSTDNKALLFTYKVTDKDYDADGIAVGALNPGKVKFTYKDSADTKALDVSTFAAKVKDAASSLTAITVNKSNYDTTLAAPKLSSVSALEFATGKAIADAVAITKSAASSIDDTDTLVIKVAFDSKITDATTADAYKGKDGNAGNADDLRKAEIEVKVKDQLNKDKTLVAKFDSIDATDGKSAYFTLAVDKKMYDGDGITVGALKLNDTKFVLDTTKFNKPTANITDFAAKVTAAKDDLAAVTINKANFDFTTKGLSVDAVTVDGVVSGLLATKGGDLTADLALTSKAEKVSLTSTAATKNITSFTSGTDKLDLTGLTKGAVQSVTAADGAAKFADQVTILKVASTDSITDADFAASGKAFEATKSASGIVIVDGTSDSIVYSVKTDSAGAATLTTLATLKSAHVTSSDVFVGAKSYTKDDVATIKVKFGGLLAEHSTSTSNAADKATIDIVQQPMKDTTDATESDFAGETGTAAAVATQAVVGKAVFDGLDANDKSVAIFKYTVKAGDFDADGITLGKLNLNKTVLISDASKALFKPIKVSTTAFDGKAAALTADLKGVTINAAKVESVTLPDATTYHKDDSLVFKVKLNEAVAPTGITVSSGAVSAGDQSKVYLPINVGGKEDVKATLTKIETDNTLVFEYKVGDADKLATGAKVTGDIKFDPAVSFKVKDSDVKDLDGNVQSTVNFSGVKTALDALKTSDGKASAITKVLVEDGVSSVALPTLAAKATTFITGDTLTFKVVADDKVKVTPDTTNKDTGLEFKIGNTQVLATYDSTASAADSTGKTMAFSYKITNTDVDTNGIEIIKLNPGTAAGGIKYASDATTTAWQGKDVDIRFLSDNIKAADLTKITVNNGSAKITGFTAPTAATVKDVSASPTLDFKVTFDKEVKFWDATAGTPAVIASPTASNVKATVNFKFNAADSTEKQAKFDSISADGKTVTFKYAIQANDQGASGILLNPQGIVFADVAESSGAGDGKADTPIVDKTTSALIDLAPLSNLIKASSGAATLKADGTAAGANDTVGLVGFTKIVVDTVAPTKAASSDSSYTSGEVVLNFSETVKFTTTATTGNELQIWDTAGTAGSTADDVLVESFAGNSPRVAITNDDELHIMPSTDLLAGSYYVKIVGTAITDKAGNAFAAADWAFTVA